MNQQQELEENPMQQRRTTEEPAPPRTHRPLRQIVVYLCITYGLTLAVALALPHAGITPLIAIAFPVIAVALTVAFTVPRGQRRAVWAAVGFNPRRGRGLLISPKPSQSPRCRATNHVPLHDGHVRTSHARSAARRTCWHASLTLRESRAGHVDRVP